MRLVLPHLWPLFGTVVGGNYGNGERTPDRVHLEQLARLVPLARWDDGPFTTRSRAHATLPDHSQLIVNLSFSTSNAIHHSDESKGALSGGLGGRTNFLPARSLNGPRRTFACQLNRVVMVGLRVLAAKLSGRGASLRRRA